MLLGSRGPARRWTSPLWSQRLDRADVRAYLGNVRAERVRAHLEKARVEPAEGAAPT